MTTSIIKVLHKLDDKIADMGEVYLSKDAVMREVPLNQPTQNGSSFESIRKNMVPLESLVQRNLNG